jgi:integrase
VNTANRFEKPRYIREPFYCASAVRQTGKSPSVHRPQNRPVLQKIRGKIPYFGRDLDAALANWEREKNDLLAGRTPRPDTDAATVRDACNAFLDSKEAKLQNGEIGARTWKESKETTDLLISAFGRLRLLSDLRPDDFSKLRERMAKKWGPVRLGNAIQRVRSVFKYAFDAGLIDRSVLIGPDFSRPSAKVLRLHKAEQGEKMFTADEIRRLFAAADVQMRAMILLAVNAGYGMEDCGTLPVEALDLESGWATFPQPKTGVPRRAALWPESVEAIRNVPASRPAAKKDADAKLVFLTRQGTPWAKEDRSSPAVLKFRQLRKAAGVEVKKGRGFYGLRKSHRTAAGESLDQAACNYIMGHAPRANDMASVFRERISDSRLRAVADVVRGWLFG